MMSCSLTAGAALPTETKPPKPITTVGITTHVLEKTAKNSHYKVIGQCIWAPKKLSSRKLITPAIEQFLPDFVVTVSSRPKENPWVEAGLLLENDYALKLSQKAFEKAVGLPLGFGEDSGQSSAMHLNEGRTKIVHVFGSPPGVYNLPFISHKSETHFGLPYYSSLADAVMDRTEAAELAYMATHPYLVLNHDIGTMFHSWGPEVPRLMHVIQPNNFRASVVAAMHAVDIVTNHNELHVVKSTQNSCGKNCVIANAVYDPSEKSIIWQEVYPHNRNIKPGSASDFGIHKGVNENLKSHGNYVFVVWRKYRGCIQADGKLIKNLTHPKVGKPQKR